MESVHKCKYNREIIRSGCDISEIWAKSEKIVQDIVDRFNRQLRNSSGMGLIWRENMGSKLIFNCSGKDKNGAGKIHLPPLSVNEMEYDLILSEVVRKLKVIFDDCKIELIKKEVSDVWDKITSHNIITIDWS